MSDAPVWVLDTNVLVSGLLSPFGRLVDALLGRQLRIAIDELSPRDAWERFVVAGVPASGVG